MERSPCQQPALYLEGYLFLVHAVRHPEWAQVEIANILDCDEASAKSLVPDFQDPENIQKTLAQPLINCLLEAARYLNLPADQDLDEADIELLAAFSKGVWVEAKDESKDLDCYDVSNPLGDKEVVDGLWHYNQDHRHSLPDVDTLLRINS